MNLKDENDYLKDTLAHFLRELRIDEYCLEVMAEGCSPNAHLISSNAIKDEDKGEWRYTFPMVQLGSDLAKKIQRFDISDFMI